MTQEPAKGIAEWQDIEFWKIVADAAYEDAAFEIKRANDAAREVLRLTAALEAETALADATTAEAAVLHEKWRRFLVVAALNGGAHSIDSEKQANLDMQEIAPLASAFLIEHKALAERLAIAEKLARTPGLGEICTICGVYSEPDKKLAKDFVCRAWLPSSKSLCPLRTAVAAEGGGT